MKKQILGLALAMLVILACGGTAPTAAPNVDTIVTQTLQAMTAAATEPPAQAATSEPEQLTPDGETVTVGDITFLIPNGLASGASSTITTDVELPYVNPSYGDMPSHIKFTLENYAVQSSTFTPEIMVFRSSEYAQYGGGNAEYLNTLQTLQYTDGQPLPEDLDTSFSAQPHALNFKNGHGVRYVTQIFQNFNPVNNEDLYYYYQGISDDGQFFVQAVLPINAPFLAADDSQNTPLPADGIPFSMDNFEGYLNDVALRLNSTDTFSFTPYLDHLDAMIESMLVQGF